MSNRPIHIVKFVVEHSQRERGIPQYRCTMFEPGIPCLNIHHRRRYGQDYYWVSPLWCHARCCTDTELMRTSGVARKIDWGRGIYVLTSHYNFKTCVNVTHVNKTVTDVGGIYTDIPPSLRPWCEQEIKLSNGTIFNDLERPLTQLKVMP